MNTAANSKGKIGILIEDHYDETEYRRFIEYFPSHGYQVEFISRLWGNDALTFRGNDFTSEVTVTKDVDSVDPKDYAGFILIGAYAMDRLRYEENPQEGQPNRSPAVKLVRRIMGSPGIKLGTICHSLWMLTAAPDLLAGREVTCAHNILYDVQNAGAKVIFDGDKTTRSYIDGDLITGNHPNMVDEFMEIFIAEIEKQATEDAPKARAAG